MVKTTLAVYLIFYRLMFFETLIISLETAIKLITENLICKSNNNSYNNGTSAFYDVFWEKDPHLNVIVPMMLFFPTIKLLNNLRNLSMLN